MQVVVPYKPLATIITRSKMKGTLSSATAELIIIRHKGVYKNIVQAPNLP